MKHFIKYNLIGVVNTGLSFAVISVLSLFAVNIYFANALGFLVGATNSYLMNKYWNFKSKNKVGKEFTQFCIVFGISYLFNLAILWASLKVLNFPKAELSEFWTQYIKQLDWNELTATLLANIGYTLLSFFLNKKWVFTPND